MTDSTEVEALTEAQSVSNTSALYVELDLIRLVFDAEFVFGTLQPSRVQSTPERKSLCVSDSWREVKLNFEPGYIRESSVLEIAESGHGLEVRRVV